MVVVKMNTPMSQILGDRFIDIYIKYLNQDYKGDLALFKTRYEMQEIVINYMVQNPSQISVIQKAYDHIKNDKDIQEKARVKYELLKCDSSIYEKYKHLVLV